MVAGYPDPELRWTHLSGARWFAAKGRGAALGAIHPLARLTPRGQFPTVGLEVAEVAIPGAAPEYYLLALLWRRAGEPGGADSAPVLGTELSDSYSEVTVHDATLDPAGQRVLLEWLLTPRDRTAGGDGVHGHLAGRLPRDLTTELPPRRFGGEQSNTSILYGEVALLKLFRRLEVGANLDIEVHRELGHTGAVVDLYGSAQAVWSSTAGARLSADVAMLVQQLRAAEDGWELAVAAATGGADFTEHAHSLGRALAEVHEELATGFPIGCAEGAPIADVMTRRLTETAAEVPTLQPLVEGLSSRFDALRGTRVPVQRVHGDFHLGQTLYAAADADNQGAPAGAGNQGAPTGAGSPGPAKAWYIIDFEGEPLKTLAERREPDARWRDVAGMLRSIDYAAATAIGAGRSAAAAEAWAKQTTAAFLAGYATPPVGPAGTDSAAAAEDRTDRLDPELLGAYVADKAIYELRYEARNRPDWQHIPLDALRRLSTDPFTIGRNT